MEILDTLQDTFDAFKESIVHFFNDFFEAFNPTILDAVMVVVLLLSAILAFARGFTRETLSLITWVGSLVAALYIHPYLLPYITTYTSLTDSTVLRFVVGGIIFVIVFAILWFASISLSSVVKSTSISGLDRGLGFLFGIFRGFILASLIFAAYVQNQKDNNATPDYITKSIFYPTLSWGAEKVTDVLPGLANQFKSETLIQGQHNVIDQSKNTLENQTAQGAMGTIIQK